MLLPNLKFVDSQSSTLLTNPKHLVRCSMPWLLAQLSRSLLKGITSRSANITHRTNRTILSHNLPCHFHFTLISPLPPQRQFQKRTNNKLWVENFRHVRQRTVRGETTKRQSRSPASPQPYCALKGNFSEDVSVQGPKRSKKREICLASYSKGC